MEQSIMNLNINSTMKCFNLTICERDVISKQRHILNGYSLVILVLLAILTAPANVLVIAALNIRKKCVEFNGFKIYAVCLAFTDLSIGIVCLPMMIVQQTQSWLFGDIAGVLFPIFDYGLGTVSVFLMTAMAFDRLKCVSSPLSYTSNFRVRQIVIQCIILWISWIAVWIPGFVTLYFQQGPFIRNDYCSLNEYGYYSLMQAVFVLYIPLSVSVFVYIKLGLNLSQRFQTRVLGDCVRPGVYSVSRDYCPLNQSELAAAINYPKKYTENCNSSLNGIFNSDKTRHVKERGKALGLKPTEHTHAHMSSQNRQCMKTCLVVFMCFIVCWGPFGVLWSVYQTCKYCFNFDFYLAFCLFAYANSAINPFIYIFSSQRMRRLTKTLLAKLC